MGGSPVQDRPPSPGSPSRPVVIVVSSTHEPSWISAARAVAAVFPCLSQVTRTRAGSERGTRRKCALVATGSGCGEVSNTARSTVASSTPPFTAPTVPSPETIANRSSGRMAYQPSPSCVTAVASSNAECVMLILEVRKMSTTKLLDEIREYVYQHGLDSTVTRYQSTLEAWPGEPAGIWLRV